MVDLEETKHIGVVGNAGSGKTRLIYKLVKDVIHSKKVDNIYVFGVRDKVWEDLESEGKIELYSMEETIKGKLLDLSCIDTSKKALVVVDDIGHTIQLLPRDKRLGVISRLEELLEDENVSSILTSYRPLESYYPAKLMNKSDLRIAMELMYVSDYTTFLGDKEYRTIGKLPAEAGEAYMKDVKKGNLFWVNSSKDVKVR